MHRIVYLLAFATLALGSNATAALAQGVGNTVAQVQAVTPLPGHTSAFLDGLREQMELYRDTGGAWPWATFQVVMGPRTGQFVFYTGGHTYADFDAPDGDQQRLEESFYDNIEPHVEHATSWFLRARPDLGISTPGAPVRPIYEVITLQTSGPDMDMQMVHVLESIKASWEAMGGAEYSVFQGAQGADPGQWVVTIPYENFASMDGPSGSMEDLFAVAAGEFQARALVDMFAEAISSATSEVFVLRRDLSMNLGN